MIISCIESCEIKNELRNFSTKHWLLWSECAALGLGICSETDLIHLLFYIVARLLHHFISEIRKPPNTGNFNHKTQSGATWVAVNQRTSTQIRIHRCEWVSIWILPLVFPSSQNGITAILWQCLLGMRKVFSLLRKIASPASCFWCLELWPPTDPYIFLWFAKNCFFFFLALEDFHWLAVS